MKIRDLHAKVNGNTDVFTMTSGGLEIMADDGKTLFSMRLVGNTLMLSAGSTCKHAGMILDDSFVIKPRAANCVDIVKSEYETRKWLTNAHHALIAFSVGFLKIADC